jgi:hypothetical protein
MHIEEFSFSNEVILPIKIKNKTGGKQQRLPGQPPPTP